MAELFTRKKLFAQGNSCISEWWLFSYQDLFRKLILLLVSFKAKLRLQSRKFTQSGCKQTKLIKFIDN